MSITRSLNLCKIRPTKVSVGELLMEYDRLTSSQEDGIDGTFKSVHSLLFYLPRNMSITKDLKHM